MRKGRQKENDVSSLSVGRIEHKLQQSVTEVDEDRECRYRVKEKSGMRGERGRLGECPRNRRRVWTATSRVSPPPPNSHVPQPPHSYLQVPSLITVSTRDHLNFDTLPLLLTIQLFPLM